MVYENMCIVCQGCLAALNGAAFPIDDLLYTLDQIYPPGTKRLFLLCRVWKFVDIENIVDGINTNAKMLVRDENSPLGEIT